MPLSIAVGALATSLLIPSLSIAEAIVVAVVLVPTDAALGQAVVEDKSVPLRVRQGLNVESGLNDGIVLPILLLFIAIATGEDVSAGFWGQFALRQVGLGIVLGVAIGAIGGLLVGQALEANRMNKVHAQIATLALAFGTFTLAQVVETNAFITVFIAGLAFGKFHGKASAEELDEYAKDTGVLLAVIAFFLFGNLFLVDAFRQTTFAIIACVIVFLTLGRILPVAVSLIGMKLNWRTIVFVGWFGPRGLASILFGLLLLEEQLPGADDFFSIITLSLIHI